MTSTDIGFRAALEEAIAGGKQGGVPIGACLVSRTGAILGRGRNQRIQQSSAVLHAEIAALENAGRLSAAQYAGATMYTTLSPCEMCTGACLLYKVGRVVVGENRNFVGGEALLRERGVEVVVLQDEECVALMDKFIKERPDLWNEDIGVEG